MAQDIIPPRRNDVAAPEDKAISMPLGTPLGVGILGAMRLSAVRRVYEHAQRAHMAKASFHDAQAEVANALTRREAAFEQLQQVDTIRRDVATRIVKGAAVNEMKLDIELLELQARKEALEEAARKRRGEPASQSYAQAQQMQKAENDEFGELMKVLKLMPEIAKAAASAKAEVIKNAGGEDKLSDADRQMLDVIDAIAQGAASQQAETRTF